MQEFNTSPLRHDGKRKFLNDIRSALKQLAAQMRDYGFTQKDHLAAIKHTLRSNPRIEAIELTIQILKGEFKEAAHLRREPTELPLPSFFMLRDSLNSILGESLSKKLLNDLVWACDAPPHRTRSPEATQYVKTISSTLRAHGYESEREQKFVVHPDGFFEPPVFVMPAYDRAKSNFIRHATHLFGASYFQAPFVISKDLVQRHAPRLDLIFLRGVHVPTGNPFHDLVLTPEHTLAAIMRIMETPNIVYPFLICQAAPVFRRESLGEDDTDSFHALDQLDFDQLDNRPLNTRDKAVQDSTVIRQVNRLLTQTLEDIDIRTDKEPLQYEIHFRISNRKIIEGILTAFGLKKEEVQPVIAVLDTMAADLDFEDYQQELKTKLTQVKSIGTSKPTKGITLLPEAEVAIFELRQMKGTLSEVLPTLRKLREFLPTPPSQEPDSGRAIFDLGVQELTYVARDMEADPTINFSVDLLLARTCPIYTGTEFEATWLRAPDIGSIAGGGRYDEIAERLKSSYNLAPELIKANLTGVGAAIGITRIMSHLVKSDAYRTRPPANVLVTSTDWTLYKDQSDEAYREQRKLIESVASEFTAREIPTRFLDGTGDLDPVAYAEKLKIPFIYFADKQICYDVQKRSSTSMDSTEFGITLE